MSGILVDEGRDVFLRAGVGNLHPGGMLLHLFRNDWLPMRGDTIDAAREAQFTGYQPKLLIGEAWIPTPRRVTFMPVEFRLSSDQRSEQIFGYYLALSDGTLIAAERFRNGPVAMQFAGDTIRVSPSLTMD